MQTKKKDYRYIVTAVDTSDTTDGKARVLKVCKTKEDAENFVENDIADYAADGEGMGLIVDQGRMSAHTKDYKYGCEWNISQIEI